MLDRFWDHIDAQLEALKSATTADQVIEVLDPPSSGDAFFAGGGGDGRVQESLHEAGWRTVWAEAWYYYVMKAPNGDQITYVEGDVYRGDTAIREARS